MVPSLVVGLIDRTFPELQSQPPNLNGTHGHLVASIVTAARSVPDSAFTHCSSEDYLMLCSALAICEHALVAWTNTDGHDRTVSGGARLGRLTGFPTAHPIAAIRSVMAATPDNVLPPTSDRFDFPKDAPLAASLDEDLRTAESALGNAEYKAT
jgi:hypothetical protein